MKKIIPVLLLITAPFCSYPQDTVEDFWVELNAPDTVEYYNLRAKKDNILFAASDKGIYKSADNGLTWEHTGSFQSFSIFMDNMDEVMMYEIDTSIYWHYYLSLNNGIYWEYRGAGPYCQSIYKTKENITLGGGWGYIFRSIDTALNWDILETPWQAFRRKLKK